MTFPFLSRAAMALKHLCKTHGKNPSVAERRRRSADRPGHASCAKDRGGIAGCAADRRPAWSGGSTVPTYSSSSSSSSETSGAPLKQQKHIKAFRSPEQARCKTGADENLQPHLYAR